MSSFVAPVSPHLKVLHTTHPPLMLTLSQCQPSSNPNTNPDGGAILWHFYGRRASDQLFTRGRRPPASPSSATASRRYTVWQRLGPHPSPHQLTQSQFNVPTPICHCHLPSTSIATTSFSVHSGVHRRRVGSQQQHEHGEYPLARVGSNVGTWGSVAVEKWTNEWNRGGVFSPSVTVAWRLWLCTPAGSPLGREHSHSIERELASRMLEREHSPHELLSPMGHGTVAQRHNTPSSPRQRPFARRPHGALDLSNPCCSAARPARSGCITYLQPVASGDERLACAGEYVAAAHVPLVVQHEARPPSAATRSVSPPRARSLPCPMTPDHLARARARHTHAHCQCRRDPAAGRAAAGRSVPWVCRGGLAEPGLWRCCFRAFNALSATVPRRHGSGLRAADSDSCQRSQTLRSRRRAHILAYRGVLVLNARGAVLGTFG